MNLARAGQEIFQEGILSCAKRSPLRRSSEAVIALDAAHQPAVEDVILPQPEGIPQAIREMVKY